MDIFIIVLLSIANFIVMFFSTVAGGGNLLMTPLTVSLGVPPANAVASIRLGTLGPNLTSIREFHRGGKIIWNYVLPFIIISVMASAIAASIVPVIDQVLLQRFLGVVVLVLLAFTIVNRKLGLEKRRFKPSLGKEIAGYFVLFISVLTVILISGGGGILVSYILIFFFGMTYLQSAGTRKVSNIFANITASLIFIMSGLVLIELMVPLFISGALGGYLGPKYAMHKGEEWVRKLFIVAVPLLALKLLVF